MKVTVVPAQVTTIEDRIAGSLGMNQLLLLAAPVFSGGALYIILPPNMHNATYKIVLIAVLILACSVLAIRIKGKILLLWMILILRFNLRPRHYVFNKNTTVNRNQAEPSMVTESEVEKEPSVIKKDRIIPLDTSDRVRLESILENPAANLTFKSNKGGLHVLITEVKN